MPNAQRGCANGYTGMSNERPVQGQLDDCAWVRRACTIRKEQYRMAIDTATGKEAPAEISSERVKDIFSTIAKKYERFNAVSSFGAYKTWLTGMMKQAPISANDDVLDIAGGTGDVSFTVARAKHPRHIQCTDLVNEMLDVARAHYADGAADGLRGHPLPLHTLRHFLCQPAIRRDLPVRDLQQHRPYAPLKGGAMRIQRKRGRIRPLSRKVSIQPCRRLPQHIA